MVDLKDIQAAAAGLDGVVHRTPLLRSETFSRLAGGDVLLKHENQQKTGAFKVRGAYTKVQSLTDAQRAAGVVAPSAGNHAQAVAWAAHRAGVPATVFMPEAASLAKVGATESYGATVHLVGLSVEESVDAARAEVERTGATLIHPFDDEVVIAGQGTIGLEILEDAPDIDAVVVPLGGGGLLSGIACAVKALRPEIRVIGWRPRGAPAAARSQHGEIGRSADRDDRRRDRGQAPGRAHVRADPRSVDDVVTVTDAEIGRRWSTLEREKIVVEGAGAVGLAALVYGKRVGQARRRGALGRQHRHSAA